MNRFHHILTTVLIACTAVALGACSMMEEDRSDCPTGLFVRFVYDYNTQRADMFKDHVGYVTVYVYDESGQKVAQKSVANTTATMPLAQYGYTMHFTPEELSSVSSSFPAGSSTPHRYRLQAVAMQKDWDNALQTPGAKYRRTNPTHANPATDNPADPNTLVITLDNEPATVSDASPSAVSNAAPMDTLWHTLKVMPAEPTFGHSIPAMPKTTKPYSIHPTNEQMVTVREGYATYATVSLIRDTKHLNITLRQLDDPADINADDYEVTIVDRNSTLASDNSLASDKALLYTPYAQWTTRFDNDGLAIEGDIHPAPVPNAANASQRGGAVRKAAVVTERTAHYNLMFNRLMYEEDFSKAAQLKIRNKQTGETVALINLSTMLAECRISPEWNYPAQEYLDREYDYELDFFLKGDKWQYCDVHIHVLSWTKRKQNVVLG
ncbi:MAG: FimB/Mfa2 family fimbrial subunit [Bacteroidales bacterium]|nr:FimB/Mfa2 family fimbrial subunit [Bacteroidales bacterium]